MNELEALRAMLAGEVEPLRRLGILVKLQDCRRPRWLCRLSRHRWGRLRHQREVLRTLEEAQS